MITALVFVFLFGPPIIDQLRLQQGKGQPIRADGPQSHLVTKKGTPTMGGLMILFGIVVSTLLWANLVQPLCLDRARRDARLRRDRLLRRLSQGHEADPCRRFRQGRGCSSRRRSRLAACYCIVAARAPAVRDLADLSVLQGAGASDLGWFFLVFGAFIIVGAGNAVNLTDGLDGLAIVPVMIAALSFGVHRLSRRQRVLRRLSADPLRRRHRRARGAVRRGDRRGPRLPLVQRAAGLDLHGRHRLARARRHDRHDRGRHQARDRAGDRSAGCSCSKRCR